ncbi:MAG: WXG100 family type VII secretion target [Angustibacter sp.]
MAGDISISHERMQAEATNLANTKNQLEQDLTTLQAKIQQLISDGFVTQDASKSFGDAHERWTQAARSCVSELELMSQYLFKTSEAFAAVDQQFTVKL